MKSVDGRFEVTSTKTSYTASRRVPAFMTGVLGAFVATSVAVAGMIGADAVDGGISAVERIPMATTGEPTIAAPRSVTDADLEDALAKIMAMGEVEQTADVSFEDMVAAPKQGTDSGVLDAISKYATTSKGYASFTPYESGSEDAGDGSVRVTGTASALEADGSFGGDVWFDATVEDGVVTSFTGSRVNGLSDFGAAMAVSAYARTEGGYSMFAVYDYETKEVAGGGKDVTGTANAIKGDFGGDVGFMARVSPAGNVSMFEEGDYSTNDYSMLMRISAYADSTIGYEAFAIDSYDAVDAGDDRMVVSGHADCSLDGKIGEAWFRAVVSASGDVVGFVVTDGMGAL